MFRLYTTPTEALLQVAKEHPFKLAVMSGRDQWSYAALWARVKQIADKINDFDDGARCPIGLYMGLEIDYVAAAHAIWLSGRTTVFLSSNWTHDVLQVVLKRSNVRLVLFGCLEPPAILGVHAVSTFSFIQSQQPLKHVDPPSPAEVVEVVPLICSITPTSGSTGVPKSIVYPMRRSLNALSDDPSTLLQPTDGQWLCGGTTSLHSLFEIRRFMFNQTTLYLDPSASVVDQCTALCEQLESNHNSQLLRVHFTPSVFRVFANFARTRFGGSQAISGFNRIYLVDIGGEPLNIYDLELARAIFPNATIACSYACSEAGFAGVPQMLIRTTDPIPSVISFGATQGCTNLVLLDESLSIIPKTRDDVTGIVAFITSQSATHYLDNDEASSYMFRPWKGDDILIHTDDVGCMQPDGTIAIRGRSLRNVEVNGSFIDLDYVERALAPAFTDGSLNVTDFKLAKSSMTDEVVLFVSPETLDSLSVFERARDYLRTSTPDNLAMVISAVRCIPLMPFNASYKIDLEALQKVTDSRESLASSADLSTFDSSSSKVDVLAQKIAAEITKLTRSSEMVTTDVPILYSGLNSLTIVRLFKWLQSEHDYMEELAHLFEEHITPRTLATEILGEETASQLDDADVLAEHIAAHIAELTRSTEAVPKDTPLFYSGLKSITIVRLFVWLRAEYAYEGEMAHLFDKEVTVADLAMEILGRDKHDRETPVETEDSHTDLYSDTVVHDQDTPENDSSEKDLEGRARVAESVNDVTYDSASEHDVYQFVVVDESDSESDSDQEQTHGSPIVDVAHRRTSFFIVDVDDSDSSGDSSDDDQARRCQRERKLGPRRYPKVPVSPLFPGLRSPFRSAFGYTFDEDDHVLDGSVLPDSPLLGSFVFSPFIAPVRDRVTRQQQPLDSMLARLSA